MFLKFDRSMISIPSKASKKHNFNGSQNAAKTNEILQILANTKSNNDEIVNVLLVFYLFCKLFCIHLN